MASDPRLGPRPASLHEGSASILSSPGSAAGHSGLPCRGLQPEGEARKPQESRRSPSELF